MAETPTGLEQRRAEMLGRQFYQVFTSTSGYGPGHPITVRACEQFVSQMREAQGVVPSITLMLDRDALFIEQHAVDRKFNARRLMAILKKIGIQSVTFDKGITTSDIDRLMVVLCNDKMFPTVDDARAELERHKVERIRLNYVVLKKVTVEQEIVSKEGLEDLAAQAAKAAELETAGLAPGGSNTGAVGGTIAAPGSSSGQSVAQPQTTAADSRQFMALEDDIMARVGAVFSLKELFERPDTMAKELVAASAGMNEEAKSKVVEQLRSLTRAVEQGGTEAEKVSLGQVLEAISTLRRELREGIAAQKEMGRFFAEEGTVVSEVDQLTYRTIVKLVREEYHSGTLSVKRLAQIIRRMLPDARDLKRLLPQLKEGLLAEGMPITEYVSLVNELTAELKNDGLIEALGEGAEEIGLTVDEIVREIKNNPREAARLVVLAAELRQSAVGAERELSDVLTEYIERISGKMALEAPESGTRDGGRALRTVVARIEKELVERLRSQGVASTVIAQVEERLSNRFQELLSSVKSDWLVNVLAKSGDLTGSFLLDSLEGVLERQTELHALRDPLRAALTAQGFNAEQIQAVYAQLAERMRNRAQMFLLPRNILSANNTTFFLQREIKSYLRYKTPFSCLMLTVVGVRTPAGGCRAVSPEEWAAILPEVFKILGSGMRDLDFVGQFGNPEKIVPFIILPMTGQPGADAAKRRVHEKVEAAKFTVGDHEISLCVAVSATAFDKEKTPDLKSFLQLVRRRHAEAEAAAKNA